MVVIATQYLAGTQYVPQRWNCMRSISTQRKEATPIGRLCIYRNNMKQPTAPPPATAETRDLYPELPAADPAPGQQYRQQQVNRLKQQLEEERVRRGTAVVLMPPVAWTQHYSSPVWEWALVVSASCPPLLQHQSYWGWKRRL